MKNRIILCGKFLFAIIATCFLQIFSANAQIASWDFTGINSPATQLATSSDANLFATPNLTRGTFAGASAGSNSFRTQGFSNNGIAVTNTDYFQFTLRAKTGYTLSVTSIDAVYAGTSTYYASPGVTSQYAYSLDGTTFILIGSPVQTTSLTPPQINTSAISALQNVAATVTVYIRYYASGQTTSGGWGYNSPSAGVPALVIGGSVVSTCVAPATPVGSITASANPACGSTTLSYPASSVSGVVYYWQTTATGTSTATATTGTPNYTVNTTNTYYVRAYTTATSCWSLSSVSSGTITINAAPTVIVQPTNASTSTSQTAILTASATGTSFQWQVNTGGGWSNVINGGVYSNATTLNLSIANPPIGYNGYLYRIVANGASPCIADTSIAAMLSVSLYCIPAITNSCDEYISSVQLNTINNVSPSPYNCGATSNGYSDYSYLSTPVIKGQTYSINIGVGEVTTPDPTSGYINDDIRIWADWNQNGNFNDPGESVLSLNNNGGAGAFNFIVPLTATNGNVRLRIRLVYDNETSSCGNATYGETEDYTLVISDPCSSGINVSAFYPTSGPVGTWVRITGSGFTNVASVKFNNVAASSFTLVNANLILARVPANAGTGKITLTDNSSCSYITSGTFTVLTYAGSCSGIGSNTDLMITEISDPATGNNHYIEVYNGTASTINLDAPDNYALQVFNDPSTVQTVDITGTIAPGQIKVYYAGSNGGLATAPAQGTSNGFNQNDEIRLMKNGLVLDRVATPNYVGYNYKRLASVTAPSSTFVAAQWTITPEPSTQSTTGIGNNVVPPTITVTAPADVSSCSMNMTASATPSSGSTYQWKYNDGNTGLGWTNLTNGTFSGTTISGANTNTLSITGDLTAYNNFQFYLEVGNSGCTASSDAAKFTLSANRYFKTAIVTGNWSAASTWLMATSSSGPWSVACTYPTGNNSDEVSIENGSIITLDVTPITIDQLTIKAGGSLIHPSTTALTIANGSAGSDFIINGTYTDNSLTSTVFNSDATWSLGTSGTIIKTNNSAAGVWQVNYDGGINTVPASANWIIRYNGTNSNIPFISIGSFYPNLTFESTSGVWTPGALSKFTGLTGFSTIKGNLDVGGTGSGTVNALINDNTNATPLQILGNLIVRAGSTLTNAGTANGTGFEIKGDITVNGTFNISSNGIGLLKLTGTTDQNISGNGTLTAQDVLVNNISSTVLVNRNMQVAGTLTFSSGSTINLSSGNIVMRSTANATSRIAAIPSGVGISYGTGKFVAERYIPTGAHPKSWQFLSVPVSTNQTINEAWQDTASTPNQSRYAGYGIGITSNISPLPALFDAYTPAGSTMKTYDPLSNSWVGVPNTTATAISNPKGYMVFVRGDRTVTSFNQAAVPTTLRAAGNIYTPSILPPSTAVVANQFASIGNPYISAIDFLQLSRSGGVDAAFYVWDPLLVGAWGLGGFQSISSANGYKPVPGGTANYNSSVAYTKIESGQAFFVHATGSGGNVGFSETAKTTGNNIGFKVNPNVVVPTSISTSLFSVNGTIADGNFVSFDKRFNNSYDGNDVLKFVNTGENFGVFQDGKILAVEQRKPLKAGDSIQFYFNNLKVQQYQLRILPHQWNVDLQVYLIDKFLRTKIPVATSDTTFISIDITSQNGSQDPQRFMLMFDKLGKTPQPKITLYVNGTSGELNWNSDISHLGYVLEYSNDGSHFLKLANLGASVSEYRFPNTALATGYYRVQGLGENKLMSNVLPVSQTTNKMDLQVRPNPITINTVQFLFTSVQSGHFTAQLWSVDGKLVKTKRIWNDGTQQRYTLSNVNLESGIYWLKVAGNGTQISVSVIVP